MNITDVRIRKIHDAGKMKAVASITFDDEFVVHDIKIIDGQNGPFIAMPSRKVGEGDFRDIAHPLMSETRNRIKEAIFAEYDKVLAEREAEEQEAAPAAPAASSSAAAADEAAPAADGTAPAQETAAEAAVLLLPVQISFKQSL